MSETIKPDPIDPVVPDYGRPSASDGAWPRFSRWVGEHVSGAAEFIGILIGIAVSARRLTLALGFGMLACGIGKSMLGWWRGPQWMFWGAVLIALAWPIKFGERK